MRPDIVQDVCWTVPVVAACVAFLTMLTASSSGILYVQFMEEFDVSHEQAAWPQSAQVAVGNSVAFTRVAPYTRAARLFAGLIVAVLQQKTPVYYMALLGALIASLGLIASSFATDITWLTVLLGGIYGAGEGILIFSFTLYTLVYFDKYRATATAFKYTGWAASGVVGPNLLTCLAEKYGRRPSLLLVGAITAHAIPLVMVVKRPHPVTFWFSSSRKTSPGVADITSSADDSNYPKAVLSPLCSLRAQAGSSQYGIQDQTTPQPTARISRKPQGLEVATTYESEFNNLNTENAAAQAHQRKRSKQDNEESPCTAYESPQSRSDGSRGNKHLVINAPDFLNLYGRLFRSAKFYALMASFMAMEYSVAMHETTVVAYGIDKKAGTVKQCNQLQTFTAVGQLVGRLVVPFLSDQIPFSRCPLTVASLAVSAAGLVLMSFTNEYVVLVAVTAVVGVSEGFLLCIRGVLYADYLGIVSMSLASGLQGLCMVPVLMGAPAAIGFFRDNMGSYDQFYWLLGAANLVASSFMCCIAVAEKQRRQEWTVN